MEDDKFTLKDINPDLLPLHIGIIMDGNGRWASQRNLPRTNGHNEGVKTAKRIVQIASTIGIKYLSLYTFSTENWKRAKDEVTFLMKLIKMHLRKEFEFYKKNNIKITHSGDPVNIPVNILNELKNAENDTKKFNGMVLNLAINHGGRNEIIRAINSWLKEKINTQKMLLDTFTKDNFITEEEIQTYFDHPEIPDIDLVIRTGGEFRISNFFIWKCAYSELFFSSKLWPDWNENDLIEAIYNYQQRNRKFGGVK